MSRIDDMAHEYEHRLMQRLSEGDEKAFRELFESYYPKVRAFVDCIVKESDTAEDIAQDIFAKIWERREIFWGGKCSRSAATYIKWRATPHSTISAGL